MNAWPGPAPSAEDQRRLVHGDHSDPHSLLGAHPVAHNGQEGTVIRAFHWAAAAVDLLLPDQDPLPLVPLGDEGLFARFLPHLSPPLTYRLRFRFPNGDTWEREDPYRFLPTVGETDRYLFSEGTHRRLWEVLGARTRTLDGVAGTAFGVWAPGARRVSVIGDFCAWDGRVFPMRSMGHSGIFELFVPGLGPGTLYKYEIKAQDGSLRIKTDPFARAMEHPPSTASCVVTSSHTWQDAEWMAARTKCDPLREPLSIYEVHLGSWARVPEEGHRPLTYREIAPRLVDHVTALGFTHIELLPIAEHPFSGSWGYQVSGYYAPTARFGSPDDFRHFVDHCHQHGIGVLLDWVPAHFPKDDFALRRFDGTALYEHEDVRRGEHPDWGTLIFNYGRHEVKNFLIANALYWLEEFHIDGLRVDAVASMLYLDYSRKEGEWLPNIYGGRENLEAVAFLRELNRTIADLHPGCLMIAEESTAWPGVSRPVHDGGLGFTFKWNMGWMHDTLVYFSKEPVHRKYHQDDLTFAMVYERSERFIMPLSHDEVVHGKGSLLSKMPGDDWQRFANLRALLTYQFTRPGKKLVFMGTELAPDREWNHDVSLDWHLADDPTRGAFRHFMADLGHLYRTTPTLWRKDPDPDGFTWIDCGDWEGSVLSFIRRDGEEHVLVVMNLTPVPRDDYRIGTPAAGRYVERFSSDDRRYGGSDVNTFTEVMTDPVPFHGHSQSVVLRLPPLGVIVLAPAR